MRLLSARTPGILTAAERRGNVFIEVSHGVQAGPIASLIRDDSATALAQATASIERWPRDPVSLQHIFALVWIPQIHFYRGDVGAAVDYIETNWERVLRSPIARGHVASGWLHLVRARAFLAMAASSNEREKWVRRAEPAIRHLEGFRRPWTTGIALHLRARMAWLGGHKWHATAALREAIEIVDGAGMASQAAAFRYLLSCWNPDDQRVRERALEWAAAEEVVNPERFFALHDPMLGF
jgi:hypothetical protein